LADDDAIDFFMCPLTYEMLVDPVSASLQHFRDQDYRGTSLIRNSPLLEPYSRTVSRVLWWP
jgi:hypothetical protein